MRQSRPRPDRPFADGHPADVPFEAVSLDFTLPRGYVPHGLCRDSNGLASGNTALEAIVHGLCEVIERDATALWGLLAATEQAATRIDATTITDPTVTDLIQRFEQAKVDCSLFDITSDIGVPSVACQTVESVPNEFHRLVVLQRGCTVADGTPRDVVTENLLATVYGVDADVTTNADGLPQVSLRLANAIARPAPAHR